MTKEQIIEQIRRHNPTAPAEFLVRFSDPELRTYLARLSRLLGHRGPGTSWVRKPAA